MIHNGQLFVDDTLNEVIDKVSLSLDVFVARSLSCFADPGSKC
jgi:hypothetical protein